MLTAVNEQVTEQELAADDEAARTMKRLVRALARGATECTAAIQDLEMRVQAARDKLEQPEVNIDATIADVEALLVDLDGIRDQQYGLVAAALDGRYTLAEVRGWYERALDMGAGHPRIGRTVLEDLARHRVVPNAVFRDRLNDLLAAERDSRFYQDARRGDYRYVDSPVQSQITAATGWDHRLIKRHLGVGTRSGRVGDLPSLSIFIDYDSAVTLASILNLTPQEAGI